MRKADKIRALRQGKAPPRHSQGICDLTRLTAIAYTQCRYFSALSLSVTSVRDQKKVFEPFRLCVRLCAN